MNPVEIEEAVSELAQQPFDAGPFPFHFLAVCGNKVTTVTRLRQGNANPFCIFGNSARDALVTSGVNFHLAGVANCDKEI